LSISRPLTHTYGINHRYGREEEWGGFENHIEVISDYGRRNFNSEADWIMEIFGLLLHMRETKNIAKKQGIAQRLS
jgi:hypothetical protein